jgi:phosphocarrier protein HPr
MMGLLSRRKTPESSSRSAREVVIQNRNGLHARPAAMLVKISSRFRSEIWIEKDGERVNGKSIMGLMMLAAGKGSKLSIIAEGADCDRALQEIQQLIENRFGEE